MRRKGMNTALALSALLCLCLELRSEGISMKDDASIIPNSKFEKSDNGNLPGWNLDGKAIPDSGKGILSKDGVLVSVESSVPGTAARCLKMDSLGKGKYALVGSAPVKVFPNCKYELSFSYRAEGLRGEDAKRETYAALILDVFINKDGKRMGADFAQQCPHYLFHHPGRNRLPCPGAASALQQHSRQQGRGLLGQYRHAAA
ncbi:MAG: hypothetical protein WC637_01865 [Victivallales bacterium]|jgi:hypothetical protein